MKIEFSDEEVKEIIRAHVTETVQVYDDQKISVDAKDYNYRGLSVIVTIEKPIDSAKET